jgi:ABC-type antimicrobial peptide transport system permease subunit
MDSTTSIHLRSLLIVLALAVPASGCGDDAPHPAQADNERDTAQAKLVGAIATAVWAVAQGQPVVLPPEAILGGVVAALAIGTVAGLYPAARAARFSPTEALRTV